VVINNAGYGNLSSVEDTPLSEFRAQIETNLFGTPHFLDEPVVELFGPLAREALRYGSGYAATTKARLLQSSRFHHRCRLISWEN
jgi:NAD(P)-dependent dehydrogenase (short-subunit alcohol dehydrogenase family)